MSEFSKIKAQSAAQLLEHIDFSEEAAEQRVDPSQPPAHVIEDLFQANFKADAMRLLAHALPKREAVWWACLAVKGTAPELGTLDEKALQLTEAWVRNPTEEARLNCKKVAEMLKHKTASSWAAMSAAWSTGSIAEPGTPEVAPPEQLYAHAVGGAVSLAAVANGPDNVDTLYDQFYKQGLDIARGGNGQL